MRITSFLLSSTVLAALIGVPATATAQGFMPGPFLLKNGNKCLDVNGPQVQVNGARVQLWDCHGGVNQQWRMERGGRIVSMANNRCLDLFGADTNTNGGRVQVWDCNGGPNQHWRVEGPRLFVRADGRCLDVHGPDMDQNGAHVQTWDCHGRGNQQWVMQPLGVVPPPPPSYPPPPPVVVPPPPPVVVVPPPMPPQPAVREVQAGPIWNQNDAQGKCPQVCAPARWNGQWRTTVPGRQSICACVMDAPPGPGPGPGPMDGPRPMFDRRFEGLLGAINAESFSQGKIRVIEDAAREHYFVIAQLRRVIESLTFSPDKIRAVEIMAPRVLDRQNAYTLYSVFSFESEKQQARAIFDRLR